MSGPEQKGGATQTYQVWDAGYYDNPARYFPRDDEVHGPIEAADEVDLMRKLKALGLSLADVRWERQS